MLLVAAVALAQVNYSRELEQRAENGDARAMFELSQCYRFGKGVEKSMRLANQWVIRAAEAGHAEAISFCDEMGLQFTPKAPQPTTTTTSGQLKFEVGGVSFTMVAVEGGTFTMGATSEQGSEADSDEKPAHRVTLSDYYIGQTEVTQALWQAVMGSNPSNWKGSNLPVEQVSWNECQQFITKLNQLTGRRFRLPTEAEWEYAARGGSKSRGYKYSGSNDIGSVAWYDGNSGSKTHPVGQKNANELGIYDMSGNVWEWCQDWYDSGYYGKSPSTNPCNNTSASIRVYRGGSWYSNAGRCRVSDRSGNSPGLTSINLGLRLAM